VNKDKSINKNSISRNTKATNLPNQEKTDNKLWRRMCVKERKQHRSGRHRHSEGEGVGWHDCGSKKEEEKPVKCGDFVFVKTHITYIRQYLLRKQISSGGWVHK